MEKFKINSQELISSAGGNEDIFNAINSPANHVFSIQRFASSVTMKQDDGTTTLLANSSLGDILTPYTLGRASDSSIMNVTPSSSAGVSVQGGLWIAPLTNGVNVGDEVTGDKSVYDESYKITAYQISNTETRIAFAYAGAEGLTIQSGTGGPVGYMVGVAVETNAGISMVTGNFDNVFTYQQYHEEANTSPYSDLYKAGAAYSSTYFGLAYTTNEYTTWQGMAKPNVLKSSNMTYSFDFYDVKLGSYPDGVTFASTPVTGTYVYKTTTKSTDFKGADNTITFSDVNNAAETYTINGIGVALTSTENGGSASMIAAAYNPTGKQSFSDIVANQNVSIAFTLAGANSELTLNDVAYTVGTDQTGTVTFGATADYNTIDLGSATFALTAAETPVYGLTDKATGTFTGTSFRLDLDGKAGTTHTPMSFTATQDATVLAANGSNVITLAGQSIEVGTANDAQLKTYSFVLSDTGVGASNKTSAVIGGYTFTDVADGSNTIIHFTSASDITVDGVFTVTSETGKGLSNVAFALSDGTVAQLGIFGFSDTANNADITVQFGEASNTLTLGGSMSATGQFENIGAVLTLKDSGTYVLDGNVYTVASGNNGIGSENKLSFVNTTFTLSQALSDTFASDFSGKLANVSGARVGSHIDTAGGDITVANAKAKFVNDLYIYNTGSTSLTISSSGSNTTITGAPFIISAVGTGSASNTLVGLSGHNFTATGITGSFYLADGGTGTSINGLTFDESVSDGYVSKLAYNGAASTMSIFGNVALTGSDSKMSYVLGGFADSNSSIAMDGMTFSGSNTGLISKVAHSFNLSNSGTGIFSITGTADGQDSFTMVANTAGASFLFGANSTTGIVFAGSGTNVLSSEFTAIFGAGEFGSATATSPITVGSGKLDIDDATGKEGYEVLLNANGTVAGISNIDGGASLTSVASATSVITTGNGTFTFNTFNGTGETHSTTQTFKITGDADGVTFTLNSATGLVESISGISDGAVIKITDVTGKLKNNIWEQTFTAVGAASNNTWEAYKNGIWGIDDFKGYIVNRDSAFIVKGIEATTTLKHTTITDYSEIGTSDANKVFTVLDGAFAGSSTSVFFRNTGDIPYSAAYSGTTQPKVTVFKNLGKTGDKLGILFGTDTGLNGGYLVSTDHGTATKLSALSALSDTTLSFELGDKYAVNVYSDANGAYNIKGAGVGISVNSWTVTVGATTEASATIFMPATAKIAFSSTGKAGLYAINSNTFTVNAATGVITSATKGADSFVFGLGVGSAITDTYIASKGGDSSLTINNIAFGLADSTTFAFGAGKGTASDTLSVSLGTVNIASGSFLTKTMLGLANDSSSLIVDAFSYTGVQDATFAISGVSGTQLAKVSKGEIEEQVAKDAKFFFNGSLFTATSDKVGFRADKDSNTLLAGSSATGTLNTTGEYTLNEMGSTTFTMNSGSSVVMTFDNTQANSALYTYTGGTGTFSTTGVFNLSDYYLSGGVSDVKTVYSYTKIGEAAVVQLSLNINNGTETVALTAGAGTRTAGSGTAFTFSNIAGYDPTKGALSYSTTGNAFTFKVDAANTNTLVYGAFGAAWAGSATRTYAAGNFTSTTMERTFNGDKFLPGADALMTLNVVDGVGSETFTSGSGTFTAAADGTFHFTLGGKTNSYTALQDVTLGAYFANATNTGKLISASGTGTRIGASDGDGTWWSFNGLGDSYTMKAGASLQLEIGGVNADGTGFGTETVTAGTGTYTPGVGGFFSISDKYLGGTSVDSYTYKVTSAGTGLTAYITSGTQISLGTVVGQRSDTSVNTPTFSVASGTIVGLAGATEGLFTFSSTSSSLTFQIDGSSTSAAGTVFEGMGTRFYGGFTTDGSATTMSRTFMGNTFMPGNDATMQIKFANGKGTETFLSGSGTFATSSGTFNFIANSDTSGQVGTLKTYTATSAVELGAYFSSNTEVEGVLYSASGAGIRFGSGTYLVDALSNTYKMDKTATITLTLGNGVGTEKFTSGTGVFNVDGGSSFSIANAFLTGTSDTVNVGDIFTYTASGSGVLNLTLDGTNTTIALGTGLVGTREMPTGTTFTFDPDGAGDLPAYTYTSVSPLIYKIAAGDSATGVLFSGEARRILGAGESTTALARVFNGDSYTAISGALLGLNVVNGATVVTETFISGSGTWKAASKDSVFHFDYNGNGTIDENEVYKALSTETALYANFVANNITATSLFNAIGAGNRIGSGTYVAAGLLGDSYTMTPGATITLTFSNTGTVEISDIAGATENFTKGEGSHIAKVDELETFHISDKWLNTGTDTTSIEYTAYGTENVELTLTLESQDSGTITIKTGMGTRDADDETFVFDFNDELGTQTYTADGSIVYSIDKDSTKAKGDFYAGVGSREFENGSTKAELVGYLGDTYAADSGTVAINVENKTEYTETFVSGSAKWTAEEEGAEFHFVYNDATNTYKATAGTTLYGVVEEGTVTSLYNATGKGTRSIEGTDTYVIDELKGDSYTMLDGAVKTLQFSSDTVEVPIGDDGFATEFFTDGNGTRVVESGTTFSISNSWLKDTEGVGTTVYSYIADTETKLELTVTGKDSGTIAISSGHGVREVPEDEEFEFSPFKNSTTYVYKATEVAHYGIDSETKTAYGDFYSGAGTRFMDDGSTTAKIAPYNYDTYTAVAGTVKINVLHNESTETFVSGSATWTANAENQGVFHFDYDGTTNTYTAEEGGATLYGIIEEGTVTSLYNATGKGTREGSGTYTISALNSDTYKMDDDSIITLTLSGTGVADSAFGTEEFTSGKGTLSAASGTKFSLSDKWFGEGGTSTETFTYTAVGEDGVELNLTLESQDSGTITIETGRGTRESNDKTFDFAFDDENSHTYTAEGSIYYNIDETADSAKGKFYTGKGSRGFGDEETSETTYLEDTYTVSKGTISVNVFEGEGEETLVGGTGTYTAEVDGSFHFETDKGVYEYKATEETTLKVSVEGSKTALFEASGAGARDLDSATTFAVAKLGNDEYTFMEGQVQLSIESVDSYSETLSAGTGYMTATGTFTAAFDASGTITENASYLYTASEEVVLSATLESGSAIAQSFIKGAATRAGIDGSDTTFVEGDYTYTIQDVANTTFVLNEENASNGAAGSLYNGLGTRVLDADYTYTVIDEKGNVGNTYTYGDFTTGSTLINGYTNGVFGTDTLYNANASLEFEANSGTFLYKGTKYIAGESGATMALTAELSNVTEILSEGSGIFNGNTSETTFTYDENTYNVSGTATLELFAGSDTPVFKSGTGVKDMVTDAPFKYTPDGNNYTLTSDKGRLIAVGNEDGAKVYFTSGTAKADIEDGHTFNYTFEGASHTYIATAGGAKLGLNSVPASETAQAEFIGGAGSRTQDDAMSETFTFEEKTYTSTQDELGWTLELNDSGTAAYEHVTRGNGRTTIESGDFVYESPLDKQTHTYQAASVVLDLTIVEGEGTETFVSGEATRAMKVGDTFALTPDKFTDEMTFTATEEGEYILTAKNTDNDTSGMLFMGYDVDSVDEKIAKAIGTTTAVSPFDYKSIVTSQTETYTGDGVVFQVSVEGGANTTTWLSGSATMTLAAERTFVYDSPIDRNAYTYTATGVGATFTRTDEVTENLTNGEAFRELTESSEAFTAIDAVSNTYTADAGAMILLTVSDTEVAETFSAGSATFKGTTFNYEIAGTSHTYKAKADVILQGSVVDGKFDKLIAAAGVGTREFDESETYIADILGDKYKVENGTFSLTLSTDKIGKESETLLQGAGTFSTTGVFHVSDYYFGTSTDTTAYTYNALDSNTGVTLGLTVDSGSYKIALESGMGTRGVETETFTFNAKEYTDAKNVAYAISSTDDGAAGYLYNAVGTRTTEDASGTTVFNYDTYNVDAGATMVLTVTEGEGHEDMTAGSATYVAKVGDVFHFEYNSETGIQAYDAISETTLQLAFEGDTSTKQLSSITGVGTRAAGTADEVMTMTYQADTYHAMAGSSTILFTATGDVDSANEDLLKTEGFVINKVEASETFHTNAAGEWYEYTANDDIDITLSLSNSVQSFNDVDAIRTASDTTFVYNDKEYTANEGTSEVYHLTGSGTADYLNDTIFAAEGYRSSSDSKTFESNWNNTYDISSGTYAISIENGAGSETLTGGAGVANFETGKSFNYGDSATSFIANIEGATLKLSMENGSQIEALTAGAGFDGSSTYIAATNAKVSIEASTNANLIAVAADEGIVTFTADAEKGLSSVKNVAGSITAEFEANGTLKVNGRDFTAVNDAAEMSVDSGLSIFNAGTGTIAAEGDFTTSDAPTLANKAIGIASDTDVAVTFDSDSIIKLEKLSDGVVVSDAAGATKAITDSEGKFVFISAKEQSFNISNDDEVTFKLDNGLVTGIAGIEAGSTFEITDGSWTSTVSVTTAGQVLTRNDDGSWTDTAVTAESYIVSLDSEDSLTVYAVDADGDLNKIDNSAFGSVSGTDINITVEGAVTEKEVYIVNESNKAINVSGKATLSGIGVTSDTAAVQLTTDTATFIAGKLNGTDFTANTTLGVTNGQFSIGSSGEMAVEAKGTANIAMSADDSVGLVANTVASNFAINGGDAVALAIGSEDSDGKGMFAAKLTNDTLSGLNPNGVDTGTAAVATNKGEEASTTFSIGNALVTVTNDNDNDGMTLEIATDVLVGLSSISTDATINVSGVDVIAIDGDTDSKVTVSADPIKYNTTNHKWIAGDAESIIGATGYFASVNADNKVELYYTTSDTTDTKLTTNKADYAAVFSGLAPENDGEQPTYDKENGVIINSGISSDVKVSIAAGSGITAAMSDESGSKDLILTTANGNYTINGQEVIPSAEATVYATGTNSVMASLNANTTIDHGTMSFTAETDTSVTFSNEGIKLYDTTKVTNTDSNAEFMVNGTVAFDSIAVVGSKGDSTEGDIKVSGVKSTVAPAELTINGKDINVMGGDLAFTVDVSSEVPVISGISGDATLSSSTNFEAAKVITDSVGSFKIGDSDPFIISNDNEVAFTVTNNTVSAIDSLEGTAVGNFSNPVNIDSDHSVLILNDTLVGVTADGTQVTAIDGVGSADSDVLIANAGGATIVTTDLNGSIYFGNSSINSQHYNVTDADSQVSFLTSSLADYTPSVSGVQGLNDGTIAISQDENGLGINDANITLSSVSSDVTIAVANDTITSVLGLEGGVNGLAADVVVNAIDSDVTVNGAALQVVESGNTNLTVYAAASGFDTVTGLNNGAVVTTAKNAHVVTEEEGVFTFVGDNFTISGDSSVTFETDENSKVKNIADFAGTLTSSENQVTVNGAGVGTTNTDASIVSAGEGVSSVLGLADGDSVSVPNGVAVEMRGTSEDDSDTALTVNGKNYLLSNDEDGLVIYAGGAGEETVTGLGAGASLTVGAAGVYNVNGEALNASVGAVIIGDEEGSAHVYDANDIDIDDNTSSDDIIKKMIGVSADDRYTEKLDAENAAILAAQMAAGDYREANGNIEMVVYNAGNDIQLMDFSKTTGIKKVSLEGGNQDVTFNNAGQNIAIIPRTSEDTDGEKNIKFGDGGDVGIVEETDMPITFTFGKGGDSLITKGRNVTANLSNAGPATLLATKGKLKVIDYDASKGQSIQSTLSNVFNAIKRNIVKLSNDLITMNNGAVIDFSGSASSSDAASDAGARLVNFKNIKGLTTKVLYTYDEGDKNVDMSENHEDIVVKANYTEGSAQRKSGTEIIRTGSGNDTGLGGSGDVFNLGSGYNHLFIDENRNLSEAGTIIEQTATTGATYVNGFHAGYGDNADVVKIDTTKASVSYDGNTLKYSTGAANLNLNAVTNSSSDLASSADITEDSRIGDVLSQKTLVQDINDSSGTNIRMEVAAKDSVINVKREDDVISQSYMGENSGVNLGTFDEAAMINLNTGEGNLGGEFVRFGGITRLQGNSASNTLIGSGSTNNLIAAGVGVSSIWGGGASNDTLSGIGGTSLESLKTASTSFFFMNGDGKDLINGFTFLTADNNDVADKLNIYTSPITNVQTSGNDVIISLTNEDDKLTIKDAVGKDFRVEYGEFGNANTVTAQVQDSVLDFNGRANYYQATGKNASVVANSELTSADIWLNNDKNYSSNLFVGDIKYVNASNVEGKTTIVGNANDNILVAGQEGSSLWGGDLTGNDTLVGGNGSDMFWYSKEESNGHDIVTNIDGSDVVNLFDSNLEDILSADVTSNTVVITMKDSRNTLTVQGNVTSGIGFRMKDGTTYALDSNRNWYQKN